jgi:hypothetical protein
MRIEKVPLGNNREVKEGEIVQEIGRGRGSRIVVEKVVVLAFSSSSSFR